MNANDLASKAYPNRPWYAVKCVYHDSINALYEERVTLYQAETDEDALHKAEEETKEVCQALEGYSYTGYAETFHLFDENFDDGVELYATLRRSKLAPSEYIQKFVRTGDEVGFKD